MPDYEAAARRAAQKYGVNPDIFVRQLRQESGLRPGQTSSAGAQGIAQFIPSTAAAYGVNLHDNRVSDDLDGAARYMRDNLKKYGTYARALSAYNSGRPDAYKDPSFAKGQTYNYVKTILGGSNPSAGHLKSGGGSSGGSSSSTEPTKTTTVTTEPAVDRSHERAMTFVNFLEQGGAANRSQGGILGLRSQLQSLTDSPAKTKTITSGGGSSTPSSSSSGGGSSSSTGSADTSAKGTVMFEGHRVAAWIAPALRYGRAHGWKGQVNSGFRSFADQTRIYNSGVRPAAKPGTSNHEGAEFPRGAVDVSDAATLSRILARSPYAAKLKWAGAKDPVHFSHPHGGSY